MARSIKNSLGYISLDCNFFDKEKMFLVEERFGEIGTLRALRLLLYLADTNGCFMEWGEGVAYYFAKKILNNAAAADMIEELVLFLIEIGFFDEIQADENGEQKTYLSSVDIVKDWLTIVQKGRLKINLEKIPQSVILAYSTHFLKNKYFTKVTQINTMQTNETFKAINATFNGINATFNTIKTRERKEKKINKQTNKQTINAEFIQQELSPETREENAETFPETYQTFLNRARSSADWQASRQAALTWLYFRGISQDLIDAAAAIHAEGWQTERGFRHIGQAAVDSVDLYERTQGKRGNANGWEEVRRCISLLLREHGIEPPNYSRLNPEAPPPFPVRPKRKAAPVY